MQSDSEPYVLKNLFLVYATSAITLHLPLEMALQEKRRKSDIPEKVLQEQKKEKAYIIHYVKLTEPDREEGPFSGTN